MATAAASERRSERDARVALRERLEARREEIEATALTRVRAISDPTEISDPHYAEGLRAAVVAAVAYGIETTGREGGDAPIPVALLAQARMAARVGIPLDTVLRRYFAGYSLLGYFILEEATHAGLTDGAELKRLLGTHAGLFDRLLAAVGEEYGREARQGGPASAGLVERIDRLLAGEQIDTSGIAYDFEGCHLGLLAAGAGVERIVRDLAMRLGCRLLYVPRETETAWAWLGGWQRIDPSEAIRVIDLGGERDGMLDIALALGEPGEDLAGWRLTHRQAAAAATVGPGSGKVVMRYADVAMLASALRDDLFAESLRRIYLEPLRAGRDDGLTLRRTLIAYFGHDRNSASAAAALGVTRQTVNYRLRLVEERIGRPLTACASEIEVALRLPGA